MRIRITNMDGRYMTRPLDDDDYTSEGPDIHHVRDDVYDAWQTHLKADIAWQEYWRELDNKRYDKQELLTIVKHIEVFRAALEDGGARETVSTRQFLDDITQQLKRSL